MRQPHVDDWVRLTKDIPELSLYCGLIGIVRSTWFAPTTAYEVEFNDAGHGHQTRALVLADQLTIERAASVELDDAETRATFLPIV